MCRESRDSRKGSIREGDEGMCIKFDSLSKQMGLRGNIKNLSIVIILFFTYVCL